MAKLESTFNALFYFVESRQKPNEQELLRICDEVTDAYEQVRGRIITEHIDILLELIKNVREKQWQSAEKKLGNVQKCYDKYVKPFIEDCKREEKIRHDSKFRLPSKQNDGVIEQSQGNQVDKMLLGSNELDIYNEEDWKGSNVAELYVRLYDKNWTYAFHEIRDKVDLNNREICAKLYRIIEDSYTMSKNLITESLVSMNSIAETVCGKELSGDIRNTNVQIDPTTESLLKMFLRRNFTQMEDRIKKKTIVIYQNLQRHPCCLEYAVRCAVVSCLMVLQDPSMSLASIQEGERIPHDTFICSEGTENKRVAYIVFPALMSSENGEVLVKGRVGCT